MRIFLVIKNTEHLRLMNRGRVEQGNVLDDAMVRRITAWNDLKVSQCSWDSLLCYGSEGYMNSDDSGSKALWSLYVPCMTRHVLVEPFDFVEKLPVSHVLPGIAELCIPLLGSYHKLKHSVVHTALFV